MFDENEWNMKKYIGYLFLVSMLAIMMTACETRAKSQYSYTDEEIEEMYEDEQEYYEEDRDYGDDDMLTYQGKASKNNLRTESVIYGTIV